MTHASMNTGSIVHDALDLTAIPVQIWVNGIIPFLSALELLQLMQTCRFFCEVAYDVNVNGERVHCNLIAHAAIVQLQCLFRSWLPRIELTVPSLLATLAHAQLVSRYNYRIAAGDRYDLFVSAGRMYSCGWAGDAHDAYGHLGTVDQRSSNYPIPIQHRPCGAWSHCYAGVLFSVGISASGGLCTFGVDDGVGQLGHGEHGDDFFVTVPAPIFLTNEQHLPDDSSPTLSSCARLDTLFTGAAIGEKHLLAVTCAGVAYACGSGSCGKLGIGSSHSMHTLSRVLIPATEAVIQAAAGGRHSMFVTARGTVYGCGHNLNGALGLGAASGSVDRPMPLSPLSERNIRVAQVACGGSHTLFLTTTGTVWTCGLNSNGQLGTGDVEDVHEPKCIWASKRADSEWQQPAIAVCAGRSHSGLLTAGGTLYTFGYNGHGQLGVGLAAADARRLTTPTAVTTLQSAVASVSMSHDHTLLVTRCGKLWYCGRKYDAASSSTAVRNAPTPFVDATGAQVVLV